MKRTYTQTRENGCIGHKRGSSLWARSLGQRDLKRMKKRHNMSCNDRSQIEPLHSFILIGKRFRPIVVALIIIFGMCELREMIWEKDHPAKRYLVLLWVVTTSTIQIERTDLLAFLVARCHHWALQGHPREPAKTHGSRAKLKTSHEKRTRDVHFLLFS